jgi:3-methyladenine DNA glycosylase AlkD
MKELMQELALLGNDACKKVYLKHGAQEPLFGVRTTDLKKLQVNYPNHHQQALDLYCTGNSDAMYLAGLLVDSELMTPPLLDEWVQAANWYLLSEYTVAVVAAESPYRLEMARKWIDAEEEMIANTGWATWAYMIGFLSNDYFEEEEINYLLERIRITIQVEANRVRYSMNNFLIAVGSLYSPLSEKACQIAEEIGQVQIELAGRSYIAPSALTSIASIQKSLGMETRRIPVIV